jgi:PhnB protein
MPATAVSFKPAGCQQVIPYLIVAEPQKSIDFAKQVFDAKETHVSRDPQGRVMHASLQIGDSVLMLGAAMPPQFPAIPAMVYLYIPDVDAAYKRALAAGATSLREPADQFYGDRSGGVIDSNGTQWWLGTHIEDVSSEEIERRAQAAFKARSSGQNA